MKSETEEQFECKKCHQIYELGDRLEVTDYCNLCAQELAESLSTENTTLRTQLKSVEADAAVMREALVTLTRPLYSPGIQGANSLEIVSEIHRRDALYSKALTTNSGKSLLERLKEAEWLLIHSNDLPKPDGWFDRRDAFLNPKPQDVK